MSASSALKLCLYLLVFLSFALNISLLRDRYENSRVISVLDGDSLILKDGRSIRLRGVDAPETGRCLADEAHERLKKETLGKHVSTREVFSDEYGRTIAYVHVGNKLINEVMLAEGLARHTSDNGSYEEILKTAAAFAKNHQLGINSPICKSVTPQSACTIKGNIRAGKKTYYLPSCQYYDQVIVDTSFGDMWFCSEEEAVGASFLKAQNCSF